MSGQERDTLREHSYDGIQEYDNPLPRWWVWIFWITIVFSAAYFVFYHIASGPSIHDEYAEELSNWDAQLAAVPAVKVTNAMLKSVLADQGRVQAGRAKFTSLCSPCHLNDGGGSIGPNLCDNYWIHGAGSLMDIHHVVSEGVPEKGMQSWKTMMSSDELNSVVAFVSTLKGTTPAQPKAPEGNLVQ